MSTLHQDDPGAVDRKQDVLDWLGERLGMQHISRRARIVVLVVIAIVLIAVALAIHKATSCQAYNGLTCQQSQEINGSLQEQGFSNER
jgi:hypothetical protein